MAIVKSLPGFEVTIVANGKPLSEYVDNSEPDQDRKTIRYIEAISDQVFEIHVKAEKGANTKGDGLAALIYVDGQSVVQPILRKDHFDSGEYMTVCQGKEISEEKVRPFCFALIDTGTSLLPRFGLEFALILAQHKTIVPSKEKRIS